MRTGGKLWTGHVQVANGRIVVAACALQLPFDGGKLVLQILEVLTGLEVWIGLGNDHQPAEQARHLGIGLCGSLHARRFGCVRTAGGYLVEHFALVGRIALHGLDEVWDEIRAPPELHSDPLNPSRTSARSRTSRLYTPTTYRSRSTTTARKTQPAMPI